jgi:hypothetical protein
MFPEEFDPGAPHSGVAQPVVGLIVKAGGGFIPHPARTGHGSGLLF